MAQDIVVTWLATSEFDRPKTETEFELWAFERAEVYRKQHAYGHREAQVNLTAPETLRVSDDYQNNEESRERRAFDKQELVRSEPPRQFTILWCKQILEQIARLPPDKAKFILTYLDSGNVVDYARERGVSLYEAMAAVQSSKDMMKRMAEDMADEKFFGDEGA